MNQENIYIIFLIGCERNAFSLICMIRNEKTVLQHTLCLFPFLTLVIDMSLGNDGLEN